MTTKATRLVWITPEATQVLGYCARVSNPSKQNEEADKLLRYCLEHQHWSVFEMASACFEIQTTRAIAPQLLRHRSFSFQEFSQRYADPVSLLAARRQDSKNRQHSHDDLPEETVTWFQDQAATLQQLAADAYTRALTLGIARESARALLPLSTPTRLYMAGTLRSWIHYCQLRTQASTQLEHRVLAEEIQEVLLQEVPILQMIRG